MTRLDPWDRIAPASCNALPKEYFSVWQSVAVIWFLGFYGRSSPSPALLAW